MMNLSMKNMKKWFEKIIMIILIAACVTSCQSPLDNDRKVYSDQILATEQTRLPVEKIHLQDDSNNEIINTQDGSYLVVEPSSWDEQKGFFSRFVVWPMTMLLEFINSFTDAGSAILFFVVIQEILLFVLQGRNKKNDWKKKILDSKIQKQIQAIEEMPLYQRKQVFEENKNLAYDTYHVRNHSSLVWQILPYVLMFGMVYAVYRSASTLNGFIGGISLLKTPLECFQQGLWLGGGLYVFLVFTVILSTLYPLLQIFLLQKKSGIKMSQVQSISGMAKNAFRMAQIVLSLTVLAVAILYINWPLAMSLYWLGRSIGSFLIQQFWKHSEKKWNENESLDFEIILSENNGAN